MKGQSKLKNSSCDEQLLLRIQQLEQEKAQLHAQINHTELTRDLAALSSETRYRAIYETMQEGVIYGELFYDEAGVVVDCILLDVNPAAAEIFGMSVDTMVGLSLSQLYPEKWQRHLPVFVEVVDSGEAQEYELYLAHLNKNLYFSISRPEPDCFAAIVNDVTASKKAQHEIERLAYYDSLTGLPNRTLIKDRLQQAIIQADRAGGLVGVLALDIDHFKKINDSLGVGAGDQILCMLAQRLKHNMRQGDSVARMGGDEFVVVLSGGRNKKDIVTAACKVLDIIAQPITYGKHELTCCASVGIAFYPTDADTAELLLKNADTAMYHAKETGRNHYQFYSQDMNIRAFEHLLLSADLQHAISRGELEVHYQPQFEIASRRIVGLEALLRWHHPQRGPVSPSLFIPLAEETDLILQIGEWVLHQGCEQARRWYDEGFTDLRVAINLSARQFDTELPKIVATVLESTQLPPHLLELELTESLLMDKKDLATSLLKKLHHQGVQSSIDDFGTGYSSLNYLKHFPLHRLKIDRSFIKDLPGSAEDEIIVEAIIALAHGLRLQVIAEGVETEEQLQFIQSKHCDDVQGFLLAKAMPAAALGDFLRNHQTH